MRNEVPTGRRPATSNALPKLLAGLTVVFLLLIGVKSLITPENEQKLVQMYNEFSVQQQAKVSTTTTEVADGTTVSDPLGTVTNSVEQQHTEIVTEDNAQPKTISELMKTKLFKDAIKIGFGLMAFLQWFTYIGGFDPNKALAGLISPAVATFMAFKADVVLAWFGLM